MRNEKNNGNVGDFAGKVFNVSKAKRITRRSIQIVESNRARTLFQARMNFCEFASPDDEETIPEDRIIPYLSKTLKIPENELEIDPIKLVIAEAAAGAGI